MRRPGWDNSDVLRTAALVIAMYLLVQLVWFAHLLFLVAFLGILFGLAVSAGVDLLGRRRIPRGVSSPLIVLGFFGALAGFGAWMAPTLHEQGIELRRRMPDAIDRVEAWIDRRRNGLIGMVLNGIASDARQDSAAATPAPQPAAAPQPGAAPQAGAAPPAGAPQQPAARPDSARRPTPLRERVGSGVSGATRYLFPFLSSTVAVVTGFLIIVFLSIYIAADPDLYRRGIMHLFPHAHRERAGEVLSAIAAVLRKWLVTQLLAMLTLGVITTAILMFLHVKAALALGVLAGLLEFIPTIGPLISSLPAIAMGFLDSPEKALWVAVAYLGVHFMESHMLIPLLMKGGINLPPALTVFSQALMALLFGFLGLMCAVPILAASVVAVRMIYVEGVVGDPQPNPGDDDLPRAAEA